MNGYVEMAKMFKSRNNQPQISGGIGTVKTDPFLIEFNGLLLDKDLIVNTVSGLQNGDKVAIIPSGNLFFVVGKVV